MAAASSGKSGIATALGLRGDVIRDAPPPPRVDPTAEALKAILGNLSNLPDAARLGERTNTELTEQHLNVLRQLIPNWDQISGNVSKNIESLSRGELPQDVQDLITRKAAEQGIATGTSGSDFNKYRGLRNLGLTSLQATDRALDSASRWMQAVQAGAPRFDFSRMFVSPELQVQTEMQNEVNRWNVAWLETQLKAQPSNSEQAWAQVLDYVADYATMAASIYGQKAMGGGGAGAGSGMGGYTGGQGFSASEMQGVYANAYGNR